MSTEYSDQFISYEDLVARCEAKGIDIESNSRVAARMPQPPAPPVNLACGMSPEGYTNANQLMKGNFLSSLGPPALQLKATFGGVAPDTPKFAIDLTAANVYKPPGSNA